MAIERSTDTGRFRRDRLEHRGLELTALAASTPPSGSRGIHGAADLVLAPRDGRTRLVRNHTRPPLVVQRALYSDDLLLDLAVVFLANPGAGYFAGDRIDISVTVEPGAHAHVTTPSATKIHAMPTGRATQVTRLTVRSDAYLEYLPEPTIPQQGARYCQECEIVVEPGGTLIYGDILSGGRLAMGEALRYIELVNRLTVLAPNGRPRYHEAYTIVPSEQQVNAPGIFGSAGDVSLSTIVVVSTAMDAAIAVRDLTIALEGVQGARTGVETMPGGDGVIVKALSPATAPLRAIQRIVWSVTRRHRFGLDLPDNRKY